PLSRSTPTGSTGTSTPRAGIRRPTGAVPGRGVDEAAVTRGAGTGSATAATAAGDEETWSVAGQKAPASRRRAPTATPVRADTRRRRPGRGGVGREVSGARTDPGRAGAREHQQTQDPEAEADGQAVVRQAAGATGHATGGAVRTGDRLRHQLQRVVARRADG